MRGVSLGVRPIAGPPAPAAGMSCWLKARRGESLEDLAGPLEVLDRTAGTRVLGHLRVLLAGAGIGIAGGLALLAIRWLVGS